MSHACVLDTLLDRDGLFFFFTLLFYSCILKILTYYSSHTILHILFIMPIIPSLNTIHHAPNSTSCYIDNNTKSCTTLLHVTGVEMRMRTNLMQCSFFQ